MEENKIPVVEEQTIVPTHEEPKPFKVYASEDEYRKDVQSVASKSKFELLKELGIKNVDEGKLRFTELEAVRTEITELSKFKDELELVRKEKESLTEDLLATKLGIKEDSKADFLVLSKSKMNSTEGTTLEEAMKSTLEKYTYFKDEDIPNPVSKIGTEKTGKSPDRSHIMDLTKL